MRPLDAFPNGNNLTVTDEEGYTVSYVYDADGRMTELTNARGYKTAYEYDALGNLVKTTDALDGVSSKVYDLNGNLLSETNRDGNTTSYTYDKLGRVLTVTDPRGGVTVSAYDGNGNLVKLTQADGKSISYEYDALNRLSSYTDTEGYVFSYTYDPNGNVLTYTDGNGNVTAYTYDGLDRAIGKTDAEGGVSSKTYDADGRLIQTVDEEGAITRYIYDADSRIVEMVDALGNSTKYTYDSMDRVLTVTDARGGVTTYVYDKRGDIVKETDAEGYSISYEYDGNHNLVKKTTVDGDTVNVYDPLDRLISVTTPDGETETFTYNAEGKIVSSTDKGGHTTRYILDANGNVIETIDALGNSAKFEYDAMNRLTKTSLHRVDTQDKVDEWEITVYEYDGRGLQTKVVDALGNVTVTAYDGNGNIKKVTDADGFVTEYTYNGLDLVKNINYNGGKQVSYQYNKTGNLVEMQDWTGTTSFELDLLHRITATNDHKGNRVEYGYDEVGNQISVKYPDSTAATKTYDLVGNLKTVTEADGRTTTYTYDGMKRVTHMDYPDGWQEDYTYDAMGRNTSILDTDPTGKDMKQQKNKFDYDVCGNMTYEYMRGNGTGEATTEVFYTYDALHRVTSAKENYGNARRDYQYDSLGNLTYETNSNNVKTDYRLNNLNQITTKSEDGWKTATTFTYDGRGNLVKEVYGKNKKVETIGAYTYDETNRMVKGVNESGESSNYLYNGLGALVQNTWVIAKNGYGYHDVNADSASATPVAAAAKGSNGKGNSDKPAGSDVKKTSTVVKDFVVDYTVDTMDPLMEYETNGLTYRYVYGNERLSVNIKGIENGAGKLIENGDEVRLYYHQDLRGTVDYLTSPMSGKVESWTHYNEWGEITHNAVLKCGQRELDLVKNYTGHEYDAVLDQYYAKARMYDAANRRFTSVDPILDGTRYDLTSYLQNPMQLVQYTYVLDNPLIWVDPLGLYYFLDGILAHFAIEAYVKALYPNARANVTLHGVESTISGTGFADLIIAGSSTEIYEIKPAHWYNVWPFDFLAGIQVNSYVAAINYNYNSGDNASYYPAKLGTSILNEINGATLLMPGDSSRYIEIITHSITAPGMIYYKIKNKKASEMEYSYSYSSEDEKTWEAYLSHREEFVTDSRYVDSEHDVTYFSELFCWVNKAIVSRVVRGSFNMVEISYADGTSYYWCSGFSFMNLDRESFSTEDLLELYHSGNMTFHSNINWKTSRNAAALDFFFGGGRDMIGIPIPDVVIVPA